MKTSLRPLLAAATLAALLTGFSGCSTTDGKTVTNPRHPGPAIGQSVGLVVGTVAGNVAGAGVGAVEGTAAGLKGSFNNEVRVVRTWQTEVTSDGRTIQVPVDILVDRYGRPIPPPAPPAETTQGKTGPRSR